MVTHKIPAMHKIMQMGQQIKVMFTSTVGLGKKCDLSHFDHGTILKASQGGLRIFF